MGSSASKGSAVHGFPASSTLTKKGYGGGSGGGHGHGHGAANNRSNYYRESWYAPLTRTSSEPIHYQPPSPNPQQQQQLELCHGDGDRDGGASASVHPYPFLQAESAVSAHNSSAAPRHSSRSLPRSPATGQTAEAETRQEEKTKKKARSRADALVNGDLDRSMSFDRVHGLDSCFFSETTSTSCTTTSADPPALMSGGAQMKKGVRLIRTHSRFKPVAMAEKQQQQQHRYRETEEDQEVDESEEEEWRATSTASDRILAAAAMVDHDHEQTAAEVPMSSSSSFFPGSPLFDPTLLATFEKALLDSALVESGCGAYSANNNDCNWMQQMEQRSSFSSDNYCDYVVINSPSSSAPPPAVRTPPLAPPHASAATEISTGRGRRSSAVNGSETTMAKMMMMMKKNRTKLKKNNSSFLLEAYEERCPPGGRGKAVLYFTSLRGVRKTFEACCTVRNILEGLRVDVDERDVWIHGDYRKELTDLLPPPSYASPSVNSDGVRRTTVTAPRSSVVIPPRLFIDGRYIGGVEEVVRLHEDGLLASLLRLGGVRTLAAAAQRRQPCAGCHDIRFVPCSLCSGSRKVFDASSGAVFRCRKCNENGLIMCPLCSRRP